MDQPKATRVIQRYPTITLTEGQEAAFAYLFANTKQGLETLYQAIFDAGLVKVFDMMTDVHTEYLAGIAAGEMEGDNGEKPS